jgi:excisionase family DNA binding protein
MDALPISLPINVAASRIGLSRSTIYRLLRQGQIRAVKAHGRTLIVYESLIRYIESCPSAGLSQ